MTPIPGIVKFNVDRNLKTFNPDAEYDMISSELREFCTAAALKDEDEIVNALCDIVVLAVGGLHKLGYDPSIALAETVREIRSRVGSINDKTGKWEKDKNQDPATLYKPVYKNARYV